MYFADEVRCREYVARHRWPNGPMCPTCGSNHVGFLEKQQRYQCGTRHAKRQFTVKVGTIFEDSPLPLSKWLPAIWLIASAKNGISSYELGKALDITQKTAWFMLHRIRFAMQDDDSPLSGKVEVDETFIGGKARFMHKNKRAENIKGTGGIGKMAVMGLLERHGPDSKASRVRTKVIANTRRTTLAPEVQAHVVVGSEVFTDALKSYDDLGTKYIHQVIDHAEEYVRGQVHTNGIENYWSLLKRAIRGTYVNVEPFHLFRYLDEESFRYNTRTDDDNMRFRHVVTRVEGRRLTYLDLTGKLKEP